MSSDYKKAVKNIYAVVVTSILMVTLILYAFGLLPMYRQLQQESIKDINGFLTNHVLVLENILGHYLTLTEQVASRTAIRKKQILYNSGKLTLDELIKFSKPKLADALKPGGEIVGIMRFDPAGHFLYSVGKLPEQELLAVDFSNVKSLQFIGPVVQNDGESYLIYYSPITDKKVGVVGFDLILVDDHKIQTVINKSYYNYGNLFLSLQQKLIYVPGQFADDSMRGKSLQQLNQLQDHGDVIARTLPVAGSQWILTVVVNRARFFTRIFNRLISLLVGIAVMTGVLLLLSMLILRPLIRIVLEEKKLREAADYKRQEVLQQQRTIVNSLDEGLLLLDRNETVLFLNPKAAQVLELNAGDALGSKISDLIQTFVYEVNDDTEVTLDISGVIAFKMPYRNDNLILATNNRQRFFATLQCAPIFNPHFSGTVVAFHDISAQKEVENTKNKLIATVGHELRTPLASIKGYAELLLSRSLSTEVQRNYLRIVSKESNHLCRLIDDFLDIRYLDNCRTKFQLQSLNVYAVINAVVIRLIEQHSTHTFKVIESEQTPTTFADADQIDLIFDKLLQNAVKFSPDGGEILIKIEHHNDIIQVSITDQGIGISTSDVAKLFEPFFQVDNELTRVYDGVGLSLVLVKGVIEAHGGTIQVTSTPGQGTTFVITLPKSEQKIDVTKEGQVLKRTLHPV